ncbi:hypothetical protein Dda_6691 [Drechslerella dactyloides]|uniref:Uncharacterized protein n=1 Tax=Drechslerella dactyloides TaxID=74499 RepID=A0AAD6IU68_DREDA|nr:hypothetical protein Dda_6691 [Drechslerella dactyloides]
MSDSVRLIIRNDSSSYMQFLKKEAFKGEFQHYSGSQDSLSPGDMARIIYKLDDNGEAKADLYYNTRAGMSLLQVTRENGHLEGKVQGGSGRCNNSDDNELQFFLQ